MALNVSALGDAFYFIAIMWLGAELAGPLGVIAVRVADNVAVIVFGLHGGVIADRTDRRRLMIRADLVRAAVLVPLALAALTGQLDLWMLVLVAFFVTCASSYFGPALDSLLPRLVDVPNVQRANGMVAASVTTTVTLGWVVGAGLMATVSMGAFFLFNAASFALSAILLRPVRVEGEAERRAESGTPRDPGLRLGFRTLRLFPRAAVAAAAVSLAMTIVGGVWIVGTTEFVMERLDGGPSQLALFFSANAAGVVLAAGALMRIRVGPSASLAVGSWLLLAPAFVIVAAASTLEGGMAGAFVFGCAVGAGTVLATSALQASIPEDVLGRVMGIARVGHLGGKALGLCVIAPLYLVFSFGTMLSIGALGAVLVGGGGLVALGLIRAGLGDRAAAQIGCRRPLRQATSSRAGPKS